MATPASPQSSEDFDYIFKIVLAGDSGVGKSCLLNRYARNEFSLDSKPTIGVASMIRAYRSMKKKKPFYYGVIAKFLTKMVEIPTEGGDKAVKYVKAQIWDTAGQERFRAITSAGALGVVVCYDITKKKSFENVSQWLNEMKANCEPVVLMLVGTKTDLQYLREVSTEEAMEFAQREHMLFMETSAQSAINVEEAFNEVTKTIYDHIHKTMDDDYARETDQLSKSKTKIEIDDDENATPKTQTGGCCGR